MKNDVAKEAIRAMARKGGKARMANLTPEERLALSRKASKARSRQAKKLRRQRMVTTPEFGGKQG